MSSNYLYRIRDVLPGDHSFLMSTFLKGLRFGNDLFREIKSEVFFKNYQKIVETLLSHESVVVKVACLPDDDDVILGYSVCSKDGTKVHWVFVKSAWRGIGICKTLVPNTVKTASHLTKTGLSLVRKVGIEYDPFSLI